jgi:hypothetical protein
VMWGNRLAIKCTSSQVYPRDVNFVIELVKMLDRQSNIMDPYVKNSQASLVLRP